MRDRIHTYIYTNPLIRRFEAQVNNTNQNTPTVAYEQSHCIEQGSERKALRTKLTALHSKATATTKSQETGHIEARHPEYAEHNDRKASFSNWPTNCKQTPHQLAEAGFYYSGTQDIVWCYACNGGLRKWDPEDDPWIEHARWFPQCGHVIREKGQDYINLILNTAADEEGEEFTTKAMEQLNVLNNTVNENYDPIYSPAEQIAFDCGFSRAAIKLVIQECNDKHIHCQAEDLVNLLLEKLEKGEVLPPDLPKTQSPLLGPKFDVTTPDDILAEHEMLIHKLKCILCDSEEENVLFLPCAHLNICITCAEDVTMCPLCGKTIKEEIRTYMYCCFLLNYYLYFFPVFNYLS